jgi:hypothetical protein
MEETAQRKSSYFILLASYCYGDPAKKNIMSRTCSTHETNKNYTYLFGKPKGMRPFETLKLDDNIEVDIKKKSLRA